MCAQAFHSEDSKDPDMHVLDRSIPETKTHFARNVHVDGMVEVKNSHIGKNLTQNGEPHRYNRGTQKIKNKKKTFGKLIKTGGILTETVIKYRRMVI